MKPAFGTPFLLQERTLDGISDYQTGRCLSAIARHEYDRYRTTSRMGLVHNLLCSNIRGLSKRPVFGDDDVD